MFFLTSSEVYRDSTHGELGIRVRTSFTTYTVSIQQGEILLQPRGEPLTTYDITEEPFNSFQPNLFNCCLAAVLKYEADLYGLHRDHQ